MADAAVPRLMSRHALVGAACALLNVGIVHVATAWLRWPYAAAACLTCFVTLPTAYFLHRRHSFRVGGQANWPEFSRFLGQQLLHFGAGMAVLAMCVEWLGLNPTLAMVVATLALWLPSLFVQWRWVFQAGLEHR